ncbi:zonadhesin-like [Ochlerotatus camptorhynchus]|uniref:zonadhesin-like n=1 Tax=Ochlerotatus camptorhynchus TaxID=644619 RepID=UPI0031D65971
MCAMFGAVLSDVCGPNEVPAECGNSCEPTCDTLGQETGICNSMCIPGCTCSSGYVRNGNGDCVLPEKCDLGVVVEELTATGACLAFYIASPPACNDLNEEYLECGTACPKTCQNLDIDDACSDECVSGCFCKEGFVRGSSTGPCIPPSECSSCPKKRVQLQAKSSVQSKPPAKFKLSIQAKMKFSAIPIIVAVCINFALARPQCAPCNNCTQPYEEYQLCGTGCPATCDNQHPGVCNTVCVAGCFCTDGYVRNTVDGTCVLPANCPCATTTTPEPCTTTTTTEEPCTTTTTTQEPCTTTTTTQEPCTTTTTTQEPCTTTTTTQEPCTTTTTTEEPCSTTTVDPPCAEKN